MIDDLGIFEVIRITKITIKAGVKKTIRAVRKAKVVGKTKGH